MLEPWMLLSLPPPPVQTTKVFGSKDSKGLEHACQNIIRVLSKQSPLHKESALLARFLYKYDKKFRNDIGYRNIRKTNTTLKKYLQLNLYKDIENFMAILPQDDDYFPTRQMLEYVLVKIITFSKIMLRVCICSKQAAVFYFDRVKRGESHWMSLIPYALLSRVCSFCTVLLQHSTSWYASLFSYMTQLQPKGLKFLPSHYELPNDLNKWLDLKNLDNFGRFNWSKQKNLNIDLSMLDNEDINSFDNILGYVKNINEGVEAELLEESNELVISSVSSKAKTDARINELHVPIAQKIDHGEAVPRESLLRQPIAKETSKAVPCKSLLLPCITNDSGEAISRESFLLSPIAKEDSVDVASKECLTILNKFQKKMSGESKVSHYFGKVTNLKSLTDFIDREQNYRNDGDMKSLTSHLSFMQWETLKSSMVKVCDNLSKSRKVQKKLEKVWKEKCSDYLSME